MTSSLRQRHRLPAHSPTAYDTAGLRRRTGLARLVFVLLTTVSVTLGAGVSAATAAPLAPGSATARWEQQGPHGVDVAAELQTTFYYPSDLAALDRAPVVLWGNGTGGIPAVYDGLLRHWASYGFVIAAANTPVSNLGIDMLAGLDRLTSLDADPASVFYGHVDSTHVIAAGHSQGGAGAIVAGADPRVTSVLALQPGPLADVTRLHSPLLMLAGSADLIVPPWAWILPIFLPASTVPTVYASLSGAGHFASVFTAEGGRFRAATTAWLLDSAGRDPAASEVFHSPQFTLADDPAWNDVRRNVLAQTW